MTAVYTSYRDGTPADLFSLLNTIAPSFPTDGEGGKNSHATLATAAAASMFAPTIKPATVTWNTAAKTMTHADLAATSRSGMELARVVDAGTTGGTIGYYEIKDRSGGDQSLNDNQLYVPDYNGSVDVSDMEVFIYGVDQFVYLKGFSCNSHISTGNVTSMTVVDDAGTSYNLGGIGGSFNLSAAFPQAGGASLPYWPDGILLRRGMGCKLALAGGVMSILFRPYNQPNTPSR